MGYGRSFACAFLVVVSSWAVQAGVVSYDWWVGGTGDKLWSTAANWSNNKVPAANSNISYDGDGQTDSIVDGDYTIKNFRIDGGGMGYGAYPYKVIIPAGSSLTVTAAFEVAGNMEVAGTLRLMGTATNELFDDIESSGNLTILPGGRLELADGSPFTTESNTSFTIAGDNTKYGIVIASGTGSVIGAFQLSGNVSLNYAAFHNLNDSGLQLLSASGQTVSAGNVSFGLPGATASGSQYLLVNGSAWQNYLFEGFDFNAGGSSTSPEYAVQSAQDITFRRYAVGAGKLYGDPETDPASTGTVIWEPADLTITSIVPSDANPNVDDIISVAVTVKNNGSAPAQSFPVDLFFNESAAPSVGDTGDRTQNVISLNPGQSTVVTFTNITNSITETWNMYAIVDTTNVIGELDETNNAAGPSQVVWGGGQPDLTITSIVPSDATPATGDTISVDVTVENLGVGDAGSFGVDLFYNRNTQPGFGDTGDQTKPVAGLAAGTSTVVTFTGVTNNLPADWNMWAIVDTLESINESDETNNVNGPEAVQWQGVDLTIIDITPSDAAPLINTSITVDVTVQNNGNISSGPFDIGLFYNKAGAPLPGAAADQTEPVASLGPGGATTVITFTGVTNSAAESWNMYAIADNGLAIVEYDESNNVDGPEPLTWRAPDLTILSITPSNSSPTAGDTITVDVVVENKGNADAGAFDVELFYNEAATPSPGTAGDQTQSVGSLSAGTQTTVTFTGVTSAVAETWNMYAVADNGLAVDEGAEDNNVTGPVQVVWGSAGTSPDLIIVSVVPSNADPAIGEPITVDVTVENQGNADAGSFDVGLFYNPGAVPTPGDPADKTQTVGSLLAGNQTVVQFTSVTSASTGAWSMYAVADNKVDPGDVTESDENNNVSTAASVNWHAPELVITSVAPSTSDPEIDGTLDVDVTIENQGDTSAGSFDVGLFLNEAAPPTPGSAASRTQNVASLDTGNSTVVSFTGITNDVLESWSMYVVVDNGLDIDESEETNNVDGPTAITWHGADLVVSAITPSDANPSTGSTISIDVTVRNIGDRAAAAFVVALFPNEPSPPAVGSSTSYTSNVATLDPDANSTVTFNGLTSAVEDIWQAYAIVDNSQAVIEGDENNNVGGPTTITWGAPDQPDLVVVSITPSDAAPNTGDTISVDVVIANNGTADASLFGVGLYYDLAGAPTVSDPSDQSKSVSTIAAGNQKTVTFTGITNLTAEVWDMYALVDSGGVVQESNESNNTKGPVNVNWGSVAGITVLIPNGGEVWESGTTQQIQWESYGDIGTSNVIIEYSLNGGTDWSTVIASTPDDGVYDWDVPLADSDQCLVMVTSEGGSYSDESDGEFTIEPAGVGKPNLKIVSISPSNSVPNMGDIITVDVTVRNIGSAASGMFYVDLFNNRSTPPGVGETGNQSQSVTILDPGSEHNVVFSNVTSASAGVWEMYAIVDTQGYVEESNETDNVSGPVQVGWSTMVDSFKLSDPNGGEVLDQDSMYTVTWTWTGSPGSLVNIELSTDGGATWEEAVSNTSNDGSYDWTVPQVDSADCRLRISNSAGTISDVSDDVFTVQKAPKTFLGGGCHSAGTTSAGVVLGRLLVLAAFLLTALRLRTRRTAA